MEHIETSATTKARKSSGTSLSETRYTHWVLEVRSIQTEGRNLILSLYHALIKGRDNDIWREGDYQSFERCLEKEFGVSPQRWAHLVAVVNRFGEDRVGKYGFAPMVTLLRLAPSSPAEKLVFAEIADIETSLGRPPGPETIGRLVSKHVPTQRPVNSGQSESDRLRQDVRKLQDELRVARTALRASERKVVSLEKRNASLEAAATLRKAAKAKKSANAT